ncbi:hypothetical protein [Luteibacter sp. ME-Dv--P-043b]|jgi:hypothetical protein|uniref:hypothetical protein n=1 Tax=Luteibacter sp. ME-Dv--P-043b TaxID=3040291 RepID=UPI0025544DA8|nr:hypothetical protein [Luteibacter sp. ME-Dv--P-043b]
MPIQIARHAQLARILQWMTEGDIVTWEARVDYLGNPVTAKRLEIMAQGGEIPVLVARHIEVVLGLPREWLDDTQADAGWLGEAPRRRSTHHRVFEEDPDAASA